MGVFGQRAGTFHQFHGDGDAAQRQDFFQVINADQRNVVVGVNGAGKTTTIGKLAKKLQLEGKKVMLAAGDTFRAVCLKVGLKVVMLSTSSTSRLM